MAMTGTQVDARKPQEHQEHKLLCLEDYVSPDFHRLVAALLPPPPYPQPIIFVPRFGSKHLLYVTPTSLLMPPSSLCSVLSPSREWTSASLGKAKLQFPGEVARMAMLLMSSLPFAPFH